jgi:hypothetical protein
LCGERDEGIFRKRRDFRHGLQAPEHDFNYSEFFVADGLGVLSSSVTALAAKLIYYGFRS